MVKVKMKRCNTDGRKRGGKKKSDVTETRAKEWVCVERRGQ